MTVSSVDVTKKDVLDWACVQPSRVLQQRIDELLTIIKEEPCDEIVEISKFEATEIAGILIRRDSGREYQQKAT